MTKHLTPKQKADWLDIIIRRDGKFACFYCDKEFLSLSNYLYDHLNNKRTDNRVDNVVLACSTCNNTKPDDSDMQILATEKLALNENSNYMRDNIGLRAKRKDATEIEISTRNYEIAKLWLIREIDSRKYVLFSEALDCISYECREETSHGSQQSVRQYINTLTSRVAPFEIVKNDKGKKIIRRKKLES